MDNNLLNKIDEAVKVLKLASEMSEKFYNKPLVITYSGGKDSDVLLDIALNAGISVEVVNSHTTVDAPDTVWHIRDVFEKLRKDGIPCSVLHGRTRDGVMKTMWSLIVKNGTPPTRLIRYCCRELKEVSVPKRFIATGIRQSESSARKIRSSFETRAKKKSDAIRKSYEDTKEVFEDSKVRDEIWDCTFIKNAKENKDLICNPILHWTDEDIWAYIREKKLNVNPLYNKGYKRVGCILCPNSTKEEKIKMIKDFPKYKDNYIKAFDRMIAKRKREGKPCNWENGEQCFYWWTELTKDDIK